jgi:flavin-dependent dehydrogenase
MLDLIVCGAGPAGLATALSAARASLRVVVVEPRAAPIDKACGEGLMPVAVRGLRELGVELDGHPISGIRYTDGHRHADAPFRAGAGLGVRRTELHTALLAALAGWQVPVVQARIEHVEQDDRCVRAGGLRARYLVAADGLHSPLRRQLGLDRPPASRHVPRWGLRQHFALPPWTDLVEVHWAVSPSNAADSFTGEAYVTPVAPDLVGVALLSSTRAPFVEQLAQFPELAGRLPTTGSTTVRGAGPLRQRSRQRVAGRVLLVGDAAGYVDALTGEGIAVGLACARALVDCIVSGHPQHYERRWLALSRRYRLITESLLWARARPRLARAIVPAAARVPSLFEAAVHQLAR